MNIEFAENTIAVPLIELFDYVIGGDWGKEPELKDDSFELAYCIRGSEFRNWNVDKGKTALLRKVKKSSLENRKLREGDILIEISGGGPEQPVGRTVVIDKTVLSFKQEIPKICTNFLRLARPSRNINPHYLNYYLLFFYKYGGISDYQAGSNNLRNLKFEDYSGIEVPLVPFNEQNRIVEKLEELFSELDKGVEILEHTLHQLKLYRQAVLSRAFEGKFTADWRKKNSDLNGEVVLKEIQEKRTTELNKLIEQGDAEAKRVLGKLKKHRFCKPEVASIPKQWRWSSLLDGSFLVVDCHNKTAPYQDQGIYLVRTTNIRNGRLILDDKIHFVSEATYKRWAKRCPPEPGDILFTREAPMGEAAIIPPNTKVCMGQRTMLLRIFPELLLPKYLHYAIMDHSFQHRMRGNAIGTGVKHLRVGDVEGLVFPICSAEEQYLVVQEIESRLSVCDKIEETIETALKQSEALRYSILNKAFKGKLVAQDPNDELAIVLLERIKAERDQNKSVTKVRKVKVKAKKKMKQEA